MAEILQPALGGGDGAQASPAPGVLEISVAVADDAMRALITVRVEPPGAPLDRDAIDEGPGRAATALSAAGVVHGIDAVAVAEALTSADGVARTVAEAEAPIPPRDAEVVLIHQSACAEDPLFTVREGARLACLDPPRDGQPGTDVLGASIAPAQPRVPDLLAGPGARLEQDADGLTMVVASEHGRPVVDGPIVGIDPTVRVADIAPGLECAVHATLVVHGDVSEGARIVTDGALVVGGLVAHAHVQGERGVAVTASCVGSSLRAGVAQASRSRLLAALVDAKHALDRLDAALDQLATGSTAGPRALPEAAAVALLVERRFVDLPSIWRRAVEVADRDGGAAQLGVAAREALATLADALCESSGGGEADRSAIRGAAGALTSEIDRLRDAAIGRADVRAGYLQACRVEAPGDLVVTGAGTYNTDVVIGGDLRAEAPGATVRGGRLIVAGSVHAAELGAPGGARLVIEFSGPPRSGERLRAAVAHAGVEIAIAGHVVAIERTTLNLAVGCDDNNGVVRTGESAG